MAKRKRSSRRPQPNHKNSKKSQHDKRGRLQEPNARRRKTSRAKVPLAGEMKKAVASMQKVLDRRIAFRLGIVIAGMLLADDRRTASAWFFHAGVQDDWDRFYDLLITVGRRSGKVAETVLALVVKKLGSRLNGKVVLGLDDSPTSRYGKHVEGAGVHHHPTPGPADGEWLYGHNWVTLAWLAMHPLWGVIALPLRAMLYIREKDIPKLNEKHGRTFQTKNELGVELLRWFQRTIDRFDLDVRVWVAVDGLYANRSFLRPAIDLGMVVVSRLRVDAALRDLPPADAHGNRIYGWKTIRLKKRAASNGGWQTITYRCRGKEVTRQYKTFLATSKIVGGTIRVVIVRFDKEGWAPYFCTDPSVGARDILEVAAARWAIEECFHDVKEVWGAGQQQVRNLWSNIACWNLNLWIYTLVELCCWDRPKSELVDRRDRAWDNPDRRPSHADRRRCISREMLHEQFSTVLHHRPEMPKLRHLVDVLIALAT